MDSWWDLGESMGQSGTELATHKITCPFCMECGNFNTVFHAEKKKPNSRKKLNFDTLECGNCKGYVMCLWSAGVHLHSFNVLPWPLRLESYPEHWPESVGRYWLQAHRSITDENWDAASVMARSALQSALRDQKSKGSNLKQEIEDLAEKGILPPIMKDWAHNVRELGNDSAHPEPDQPFINPHDARDIVQFVDFLLEYLYTLPYQISEYRARTKKKWYSRFLPHWRKSSPGEWQTMASKLIAHLNEKSKDHDQLRLLVNQWEFDNSVTGSIVRQTEDRC